MPMDNVSFSFSEDIGEVEELCERFDIFIGDKDMMSPRQKILLLKVHKDEEIIGMASGMYFDNENSFHILALRINDKENLRVIATTALSSLLEEAKRRFKSRRYEWFYDIKANSRDIYASFIKMLALPWLKQVSREVLGRRALLLSSGMTKPTLPHNRASFSRESFDKSGFRVVSLADIDSSAKEKIDALLASPKEENVGLSPFVGKDYDNATSFVIVDNETGDVAGWIVCRKRGKFTDFRRWYCASRYRHKNLGVLMVGLLLRTVQEISEGLIIFMLYKSASSDMLGKFYKSYFKGSIASEMDFCHLVLEDSEEQ